jgi:hypothetical protein
LFGSRCFRLCQKTPPGLSPLRRQAGESGLLRSRRATDFSGFLPEPSSRMRPAGHPGWYVPVPRPPPLDADPCYAKSNSLPTSISIRSPEK